MANDYTIIVTVAADEHFGGQREVFYFIRRAIEDYVESHEDLAPEMIRLSTPDEEEVIEI